MKKMKLVKQVIKYKVIRKTSEYNKYIKWLLVEYREDNSVLAELGYRTEKEARSHVVNSAILMPMGNRLIQTIYQEI